MSLSCLSQSKGTGIAFLPLLSAVARIVCRGWHGSDREYRHGLFIQVLVGETRTTQDLTECFHGTQVAGRALGLQILNDFGSIEHLELIGGREEFARAAPKPSAGMLVSFRMDAFAGSVAASDKVQRQLKATATVKRINIPFLSMRFCITTESGVGGVIGL